MGTRTDRHQVFAPDGMLLSEEVVEVDTTLEENEVVIVDYLVARQTRLKNIRTQAQNIAATTGTLSSAQLSNHLRTIAGAVDDLAQFDIRLARRVLSLYDSTD